MLSRYRTLRLWQVDEEQFSFSSVGRRESHDAVRQCLSMPVPGGPLHVETDGHADISGDAKVETVNVEDDIITIIHQSFIIIIKYKCYNKE